MGHRYIGSKLKILDEVLDRIEEITPKNGVVCDLMCGTSAVSKGLRDRGFSVIAVDVMTYSFHHARVALLLDETPKFRLAGEFIGKYARNTKYRNSYEGMIDALNNIKPRNGYFFREFSLGGSPKESVSPRNYFSVENARKIDGVRYWIKKLHKGKKINDLEHSLLLNDLILSANDVANISGTYGHYLSKLTGRANESLALRVSDLSGNGGNKSKKHQVLRGYAEELASQIKCDVCYIDPPYMKRQYAANYHILETLAREDSPRAVGVSGLRPWRDQYSNFCTKTKIWDSFDRIFKGINSKKILISYSEDGLIPIKELSSFFGKYGDVVVSKVKNRRFKSNSSQLDKFLTEYLIEITLRK